MKIAFSTSMFLRHEIFSLWAEQVLHLQKTFPQHEYAVVVAGSERSASQRLAESYGFDYIEHRNNPLGEKHNARMERVMFHNPDVVVMLGSDDLMCQKTFEYAIGKVQEGFDVVHHLDLYFYDSVGKRSFYNEGYTNHRRGEPMAVGRVLNAKVLYEQHPMYPAGKNRGHDYIFKDRLVGYSEHIYTLRQLGLCVVDVKSKTNLTPINKHGKHIIKDTEVWSNFPKHIQEIVSKL